MIEMDQILEGLVQRTTEGKLKWERAVQADRFVASVGAISIVITEVRHSAYRIEVLNEAGETVEDVEFPNTTDEQNRQLERLFALARRSALNTEATLEKLAKALDV